jgi:2-polyprenyl-6-methoxyphenol hydroxylase-like FAD-dependent oxidoreductase
MPTPDKGEHPAEHEFLVNFFPIEDNRVIACMGSWGLEMPRTTEAFAETARRVRTPLFAAAMDRCAPTSEVHLTRSTGNKWRRYDRWATPPRGLAFVGDSICAFNPFYAQGISSAAGSALLLREHLSRAGRLDAGFSARFLAAQRKLLNVPWRLAMARDQGYECAVGTEKPREWRRRLLAAVSGPAFSLVVGAAREDDVVDEHFAKVFNLDESLGEMLRNPRVLAGLVRYRLRAALGKHRVPFGFDPRAEPPATDYSPAATTATAR